MSKQIDGVCYANQSDAFISACNSFNASSVLSTDGAFLTSVSCSSSDSSSIILRIQKTEVATNVSSTAFVHQVPDLHECVMVDYVDAGKLIFGACILVWASCYGLWKIKSYLDWSRSNE